MSYHWEAGQNIYRLLNRAQHQMRKKLDTDFLEQLGVTSIQLAALIFMANNEDCLLGDLSEGLSLNNSAITGVVAT